VVIAYLNQRVSITKLNQNNLRKFIQIEKEIKMIMKVMMLKTGYLIIMIHYLMKRQLISQSLINK